MALGSLRRLLRSVSLTTRPPRPGEVNGQDYHFVTEQRFFEMSFRGELLERGMVYGHHYGTPRAVVENCLDQGMDVLLILDAQGRQQLALSHAADLVSVFLLPPEGNELEHRLRSRNQDDEETIARRLQAVQHEIAQAQFYDHILENDDPGATLECLDTILCAERMRRIHPVAFDDW